MEILAYFFYFGKLRSRVHDFWFKLALWWFSIILLDKEASFFFPSIFIQEVMFIMWLFFDSTFILDIVRSLSVLEYLYVENMFGAFKMPKCV